MIKVFYWVWLDKSNERFLKKLYEKFSIHPFFTGSPSPFFGIPHLFTGNFSTPHLIAIFGIFYPPLSKGVGDDIWLQIQTCCHLGNLGQMADMIIYDSLVTKCHCTFIINLSSDGDLENSLETKNLLNFLKTLVFYKLVSYE